MVLAGRAGKPFRHGLGHSSTAQGHAWTEPKRAREAALAGHHSSDGTRDSAATKGLRTSHDGRHIVQTAVGRPPTGRRGRRSSRCEPVRCRDFFLAWIPAPLRGQGRLPRRPRRMIEHGCRRTTAADPAQRDRGGMVAGIHTRPQNRGPGAAPKGIPLSACWSNELPRHRARRHCRVTRCSAPAAGVGRRGSARQRSPRRCAPDGASWDATSSHSSRRHRTWPWPADPGWCVARKQGSSDLPRQAAEPPPRALHSLTKAAGRSRRARAAAGDSSAPAADPDRMSLIGDSRAERSVARQQRRRTPHSSRLPIRRRRAVPPRGSGRTATTGPASRRVRMRLRGSGESGSRPSMGGRRSAGPFGLGIRKSRLIRIGNAVRRDSGGDAVGATRSRPEARDSRARPARRGDSRRARGLADGAPVCRFEQARTQSAWAAAIRRAQRRSG